MLGKETIHMLNTGESRGQSSSYSMNYQSLGKELMSMDEIGVMDGSKCILQVRGVRPFISTKYDIEKHHNYKYLADADPGKNFDIAAFVKAYKESKKELLEGLSKKNTKHIVIEINEDEPEKPKEKPVIIPVPISDATPAEEDIAENTGNENGVQPETQKDIDTDNNEDGEHEDDTDYFDPDDTELV
jgi:type IV secretory pathway TraG/TraD family ATPase VirD4